MIEQTNLGEFSCKNLRDAQIRFGIPIRSGGRRSGNWVIPIVGKPKKGNGFPYISVPEGVHALKFRNGVMSPREPLKPGFHLMDPFSKITTVMTAKHTLFDIPVKKCQSKDNIDVHIDLFCMFRIRNPVLFHDKLSATKLGLVMTASLEEAIRELAQNTRHTQIYDLVQFDESEITVRLDKKFDVYGVDISEIVITNVGLPKELEMRLQNETTYHSRNRLQKRKQEFDVTVTRHQEELEERRLLYKNERLAYDDEQERERAKISKEIEEIKQRTEKLLAEIKAEEDRIVQTIEEEAAKERARLLAERDKVLSEMKAQGRAKKAKIDIDVQNYRTEILSKSRIQVAQDRSNATKVRAKSENTAASMLKEQRSFRLKMMQLDNLRSLAHNKNVVISGKTNNNILAQMAASITARPLYLPFKENESKDPPVKLNDILLEPNSPNLAQQLQAPLQQISRPQQQRQQTRRPQQQRQTAQRRA